MAGVLMKRGDLDTDRHAQREDVWRHREKSEVSSPLWTSGLQNWEVIHFCCLSHLVSGALLRLGLGDWRMGVPWSGILGFSQSYWLSSKVQLIPAPSPQHPGKAAIALHAYQHLVVFSVVLTVILTCISWMICEVPIWFSCPFWSGQSFPYWFVEVLYKFRVWACCWLCVWQTSSSARWLAFLFS